MYKISLPIKNGALNEKNKPEFVELCKKARVDRVFLTASLTEDTDRMRENLAFFKENGFETGIWVGNTIGHGSTLLGSHDSGEKPKYQRLVNLEGTDLYSTNCPFDKEFQKFVAEGVARLTTCGTDILMLDDDYRLSQHGRSPCCCCELHMAKIREYCGEDISREELARLAFTGKKNKYRDAWMRAQGESLEELAHAIRAEVDKVNPRASISACSAYCSWDLDGTDPIRLTKILCGKNHKFVRLHGAPYWAPHNNKPVEAIPEIERMFASFFEGEDIEIFSEGDVYPRPRFNTPASFLEIFDGALRADKQQDGILKYMLNYSSIPLYETGYIDRHVKNLPKHDAIDRYFEKGANAGVRILIRPHLLNDADLSISPLLQQSPYPTAGIFLAMNAIPTVYSGEGICKALFGENARHFDPSDFEGGAILDGAAAKILTERGIDVGLASVEGSEDQKALWTENVLGGIADTETGYSSTAIGASVKRICSEIKPEAKRILSVSVGGEHRTFAYKYENAEGQRFFVFTFIADALSSYPKFLRSYEIQSALIREIEWVARKPLPVKTERAPELYTLCEKGENYTSVALFNCFQDCVLDPVIVLDKEYAKVEFSGCSGRIEGNKVFLDTDIPAFDFVSFRAYN
ncbi:MAG: hypothetical protein IJY39_01475 [Clostridia bacterium]|nr:hypothetical protein [Clostridia bacterium]